MSKYKEVEKPWGKEKWLALTDHYCFKEIIVWKGCRTSLQYHEQKEETNLIVSGQALVTYKAKDSNIETCMVAGPGFVLHLPPGAVHRFEALEDLVLHECSTIHVDDVVRLEDSYGRQEFPKK